MALLTVFILGYSRVNHSQILEYINRGYIAPDSAGRPQYQPPGNEIVPKPRPYEAVVFRDFFAAGLKFPLDNFVSMVLERFNLQLHQLTPNAILRLGCFVMAHKMYGREPSVEAFTKYYKVPQRRGKAMNPDTGEETYSDFGGNVFEPKTDMGEPSLVPTFKSKWLGWTKYWFYHWVCPDSEVEAAEAEGRHKACTLVSVLTSSKAAKRPPYRIASPRARDSEECYLSTG